MLAATGAGQRPFEELVAGVAQNVSLYFADDADGSAPFAGAFGTGDEVRSRWY